jgi:hypothetical protein
MKKMLLLILAVALTLPLVSCKKEESLGDKLNAAAESAKDAAADAEKEAKKALE